MSTNAATSKQRKIEALERELHDLKFGLNVTANEFTPSFSSPTKRSNNYTSPSPRSPPMSPAMSPTTITYDEYADNVVSSLLNGNGGSPNHRHHSPQSPQSPQS